MAIILGLLLQFWTLLLLKIRKRALIFRHPEAEARYYESKSLLGCRAEEGHFPSLLLRCRLQFRLLRGSLPERRLILARRLNKQLPSMAHCDQRNELNR